MDIRSVISKISKLTGSSITQIVHNVNKNFSDMSAGFLEFLNAINFNQTNSSIALKDITSEAQTVSNKTEYKKIGDNSPKMTLDSDGRIEGQSSIFLVSQTERQRFSDYGGNFTNDGIPGEIVYIPNGFPMPEGHYGYYYGTGWKRIGGQGSGGSGGGGVEYFADLLDVDVSSAQDGQVPMYSASLNKWIPAYAIAVKEVLQEGFSNTVSYNPNPNYYTQAVQFVISQLPYEKGIPKIYVNGLLQELGDGTRDAAFYFSIDNGVTALTYTNLQLGAKLYVKPHYLGYSLQSDTFISVNYLSKL